MVWVHLVICIVLTNLLKTSKYFLEMFWNNLLDVGMDPVPYGTHSFGHGGVSGLWASDGLFTMASSPHLQVGWFNLKLESQVLPHDNHQILDLME
jgi:hypothetical protein